MSGAADPVSAVADILHETKTTEPTNNKLLQKKLHNQQISNQPINQQQNVQKHAREVVQAINVNCKKKILNTSRIIL